MNAKLAFKNIRVTTILSASSSSSVTRQFSTVAPHTPDQLKQYALKAEKHKQFVQQDGIRKF